MTELLCALLVAAGLALWLWGRSQLHAAGLPAGQWVYSDTGAEQEVAQPLLSRRYGLVGKPDYLVQVRQAGRQTMVPVEVKSGRAPAEPAPGHLLQLATYCLIVEDLYGVAPACGILRYADRTFEIPFTEDLRRAVLAAADQLRAARRAHDLARSHQEPARCRQCGYRQGCGDQAL